MSEESPIRVQLDGKYNTIVMKTKYKPGQGASQMTGLLIEEHTDQKQIIGMFLANKLCWMGAYLRGLGYDVTCPDGHEGCTANVDIDLPFSEKELGSFLGKQASLNNLLIRYATTDGDGRAAEGLDEHFKSLNPLNEVLRLSDLTHLGTSQIKAVGRASFSKVMFDDIPGYENKKRAKQVLGNDIGYRCGLEFNGLYKSCNGNIEEISKKINGVVNTILDCYAGNHKNCSRYSCCCKGGSKTNWFTQSYQLRSFGYHGFNMTKGDRQLMKEIMNMKLGVEALNNVKFATTTQAAESYNRSLNANCPKNVKYSRSATHRMASTVHKINNGPGLSTRQKLEHCGVKVVKGSATDRYLNECDKRKKYQQNYVHRSSVKRRRHTARCQRYGRYYKKMEKRKDKHCDEYRKGQLDPTVAKKSQNNITQHNLRQQKTTEKQCDCYSRFCKKCFAA